MALERSIWMTTAVLLGGAGAAFAQTATPTTPIHTPLHKAIGQAGPEIVPSLIVMNARGASLQGRQLILMDVAPNSVVFAAAAQTAKQQCISTCRARYRACLSLKQIPSSECRGVYQDCTRFACNAVRG
jgi:hypothetical protein